MLDALPKARHGRGERDVADAFATIPLLERLTKGRHQDVSLDKGVTDESDPYAPRSSLPQGRTETTQRTLPLGVIHQTTGEL